MKDSARPHKIRLLLVDDHAVMRMGLMTATGDQSDMEVVGEVDNGMEAIDAYRSHRPDVAILDLRMPGWSGIETIRRLKTEFPEARILVFSNFARGEEVYNALRSGAAGIVVKQMALHRLLEAIRKVHTGEQYIPPEVATRIGERLLSDISSRELEVLQLLGKGRSNKEIASALGITSGTVKIHVSNILTKLGAADRTQALVTAIQRGIIDVE